MNAKFTIPPGHKYALLTLHTCASLQEPASLGDGVFASPSLPIELPDHWNHWLGEFKIKSLIKANLFISIIMPSSVLGVLDAENNQLINRAEQFFRLLTLAGNIPYYSQPQLLTGSSDAEVSVRQLQELPKSLSSPGLRLQRLDEKVIATS